MTMSNLGHGQYNCARCGLRLASTDVECIYCLGNDIAPNRGTSNPKRRRVQFKHIPIITMEELAASGLACPDWIEPIFREVSKTCTEEWRLALVPVPSLPEGTFSVVRVLVGTSFAYGG